MNITALKELVHSFDISALRTSQCEFVPSSRSSFLSNVLVAEARWKGFSATVLSRSAVPS